MNKASNLLSIFTFYMKKVEARLEKERVLRALALSFNTILKLECSEKDANEIQGVIDNIFPDVNCRYTHNQLKK